MDALLYGWDTPEQQAQDAAAHEAWKRDYHRTDFNALDPDVFDRLWAGATP